MRIRHLRTAALAAFVGLSFVGLTTACPDAVDDGCLYNSIAYSPGEAFDAPDGCNQCVCGVGGSITCTEAPACLIAPSLDAGQCSGGQCDAGSLPDSGALDSGVTDSGALDSGVTDSGIHDSGLTDSGTLDSGVTDSGVTDSGVTDSGILDGGPVDGGVEDGSCRVPTAGKDGCPCGYLDRSANVGGLDATFAEACAQRPICESSCCGAGTRPHAQDLTRCVPDDSLPPVISSVQATAFVGPGPVWSFEIRVAALGADRCRVTGTAGNRTYDFVGNAYLAVTFTSSVTRYDLSEIDLVFLCENDFGLAVESFVRPAAENRAQVSPTSNGSPFRGLLCLEDLFDGPCSVNVCGGQAIIDENAAFGGECTGGYVVTLDLASGTSCAPVDALVLAINQELLINCVGPSGFHHAYKTPMSVALDNAP